MAANTLFDLAQTVLDYAVLSLDSIPADDPELAGAPDRRFVAPGQPAMECCQTLRGDVIPGQLSVHVETMLESDTAPLSPSLARSARPATSGRVNQSGIVVMISRCSPIGVANRPPTPEQWTFSARQIQADGWALWNGLWRAQHEDDAFAEFCDGVFYDPAQNLPPQGGCGGWIFVLRPVMPGYNPLP